MQHALKPEQGTARAQVISAKLLVEFLEASLGLHAA
jgi:hypothetical protein